jgi:asparagine synthase (glutamine-hydrolysing)
MSIIAGSVDFSPNRAIGNGFSKKYFDGFVYDRYGEWHDAPVYFSYWHRDVSPQSCDDKQPLNVGDHLLIADIRLDNRDELVAKLSGVDASSPDSELLLAAYYMWGSYCVNYLLGAFAFAIWDKRTETLFCARDQMGQKPLYYSEISEMAGSFFSFCSSPTGLLKHPKVKKGTSPEGIFNVLMGRECNELSETVFSGVKRLAAGFYLQVDRSGSRLRRYWEPSPGKDIRYACDQDYADDFKERFNESVQACINTSWPVSSFLSGGLDSSTVACTADRMLKQNGRKLITASFVLPEEEKGIDEREQIEQILAVNKFDHSYITKEGLSFTEGLQKSFQLYQGFPCLLHAYYLNLLPALYDRDVRVHLCGYGGDQVASYHGMWVLEQLFLEGRWSTLYALLRTHSQNKPIRMLLNTFKSIFKAALPDLRDEKWYLQKTQKKLILKGLANRSGFREKVLNTSSLQSRLFPSKASDIMRRLIQYDKTSVRLEQISAVYLPFGIEYRTPLNDIRLIQYCMSIPPEQLLIGQKRSLMRRAAKGIIPESIRLGHNKHQGSLPNLFDLMWEDRDKLVEQLQNCGKEEEIQSLIDFNKLDHYLNQQQVPESIKPKLFRNVQMALFLAWHRNNVAS